MTPTQSTRIDVRPAPRSAEKDADLLRFWKYCSRDSRVKLDGPDADNPAGLSPAEIEKYIRESGLLLGQLELNSGNDPSLIVPDCVRHLPSLGSVHLISRGAIQDVEKFALHKYLITLIAQCPASHMERVREAAKKFPHLASFEFREIENTSLKLRDGNTKVCPKDNEAPSACCTIL